MHHLRHLQKKVIRSERNKANAQAIKAREEEAAKVQFLPNEIYYNENISSDQQVPRIPTRFMYH